MSTKENDIFMESLYEIIAELEPYISSGEMADFQRFIAENDLEGAKAYVESLEARYADDLREPR